MKKRYVSFYFITLMAFCQGLSSAPVIAITDGQKDGVMNHCETIRDNLKNVQKQDARTRVYLGGYYETILTDFVRPLNMLIVANNLSAPGLIENQSKMATEKSDFTNDYVHYQQGLEELVAIDCKKQPEKFYEKLESVRKMRKLVEQDLSKLRSTVKEHTKLVTELEGRLNGAG